MTVEIPDFDRAMREALAEVNYDSDATSQGLRIAAGCQADDFTNEGNDDSEGFL